MTRHFGGMSPARQTQRMRSVLAILGLFGVVFSLIAIIVISTRSSDAKEGAAVVIQKANSEQVKNVLIPLQRIEPGSALEPAMFRLEPRATEAMPPGAVSSLEEIRENYAKSAVLPDLPLLADQVTKTKPINLITANIPEGYRAVTIGVDARSGVEGWALPGARVDVVWASQIRGQKGIAVIVENAKVLSAERQVDSAVKAGAPVPTTITLLVSAEDANKIQLASTAGTMSLSLRGDRDAGKGQGTNAITLDDLVGGGSKPVAPAPPSCLGMVKTCDKGVCQELCLTKDGKLQPR